MAKGHFANKTKQNEITHNGAANGTGELTDNSKVFILQTTQIKHLDSFCRSGWEIFCMEMGLDPIQPITMAYLNIHQQLRGMSTSMWYSTPVRYT